MRFFLIWLAVLGVLALVIVVIGGTLVVGWLIAVHPVYAAAVIVLIGSLILALMFSEDRY